MNAGHPRQAIDAMPFAERTALLEQAARKFRELHPDFEINRTPSIIRPPHHLKRNAERQFRCAGEAVIFVNYAFLSKGKRNMTFY
jgi:hypothetical protein